MALTKAQVREILSEAGIETSHMSDAVEKIIDGHVSSVNALREEISTYKADAAKLPGIQKELDELKAKVEADAKERKGKDFDALKAEYDQYKADVEAREKKAATEARFSELLKDIGVTETGVAKILKWQGVQGVELGEDGKISNAKDLRKAIKEDWPEYIATERTQGASTPAPPANTGGGRMTKEQIMAIKDDIQRQTAIAKNLDLFGG